MTEQATPSASVRRSNYGHSKREDLLCTHFAYDLSCAAYDEMRDRAGDACEICRTPDRETKRGSLVIDHFQGGGLFIVRGLLCDKCNSVMSRHDRTAPWGPASLPWEDAARAYHLNAFSKPSPDELRRADEYIQSHGTYKPGDVATTQTKPTVPRGAPYVRLDHGPKQIARKLRDYLNDEQLARLVALLTDND